MTCLAGLSALLLSQGLSDLRPIVGSAACQLVRRLLSQCLPVTADARSHSMIRVLSRLPCPALLADGIKLAPQAYPPMVGIDQNAPKEGAHVFDTGKLVHQEASVCVSLPFRP